MAQHWKQYSPSAAMPWNLQRAKHLYRRASLGGTWSELHRAVQEGHQQSVDRLLSAASRIDGLRHDFEEMSQIIGDAAAGSSDASRLKAWWLFRMLFTPDPLQEKLTLLWHNHFATSNLKVQDLLLMRQQNELFRANGNGKFGVLLHGVLRDPAMMYWLDANSNRKGHPNENLARELLELFTLGVENYTENDVKGAAQALTGWKVKRAEVTFREDRHDSSEKTILGKHNKFNTDSLTESLLAHPATSKRLAWRLCDVFMGEGVVDQSHLDELAEGLHERELNIGWGVETILRSELFFADKNIASRVSSPVEYIVNAVRSLEIFERPPSTLILAEWCSRLGQELFYPPNVGGWAGGRAWLTSRNIVARSNFAAALVAGEMRSPITPPLLDELVAKCMAVSDRTRHDVFEILLLSVRCSEPTISRQEKDLSQIVAHLLSCPQAYLV